MAAGRSFPQFLWITLWMAPDEGSEKPASAAIMATWSNFDRGISAFPINYLRHCNDDVPAIAQVRGHHIPEM
jgi:hypothetical protein